MIKLSDKYNIHRVGGKTCADPEFFFAGRGVGRSDGYLRLPGLGLSEAYFLVIL